jgi:two-component system NtrC family sensor kinase
MRGSLRTRLTVVLVVVIALNGLITVWVGLHLIGDEIIKRARDDVRIDLNSAREIYTEVSDEVNDIVRLTAVRFFLKDALATGSLEGLAAELASTMKDEDLDVLTVTDASGKVIVRASNPGLVGDSVAGDQLVARVLSGAGPVVATVIAGRSELEKENTALAARAFIEPVPTPMASPRPDSAMTSGMMIEAVAPIVSREGELLGVLYGGRMLNRSYDIVDLIKDTVYGSAKYKGKETGTATIFEDDLRISTNVIGSDGRRAIGTRVSREVYDWVVGQGKVWVGRAFVVNDWYITAYEPLRDIDGKVIGMLYVGMLEAPYVDLRRKVGLTFAGIGAIAIVVMSLVSYMLSGTVVKPIGELLRATKRISGGDLTYRVRVAEGDEVGQLAASFNRMTEDLQAVRAGYDELTETLEEKVREKTQELQHAHDRLIQSEKLTSLGKMAAGIAHEINNPLTSILINSHLLAESLTGDDETREGIDLIVSETARCGEIVRGLLEFSRQSPPQMVMASLNDVIEKTLALFRTQILASRVHVIQRLDASLPETLMDANKMEQAFSNLILNAVEAMHGGGVLTVSTRLVGNGDTVEVSVSDTGSGISEADLPSIFDPFYTTKGTKGTGLGLSITYGIIEQHGGKIEVESRPGEGSVFRVLIPLMSRRQSS